MHEKLKRILFRVAKPLLHPFYRQARGMTLGTRTMVLRNDDTEVLLLRHGYAPGWLLPGGGVERGEALAEAALRELREEAVIEANEADLILHGLFLNERNFRGDHVACFVLRRFRQGAFRPGFEVTELRFFPVAELPEATTPGTRRRISEVTAKLPPAREW